MKKLIIIVLALVGITLVSCEKKPFDYRNKFVGKYEFTTLETVFRVACCESNLACCTTESHVIYQGEITLGREEDEVVIDYIDSERNYKPYGNSWSVRNGKLYIKVNKEGSAIGFSSNGNVEFKVSFTGKTADGTSHSVIGKKNK